MFVGWGNIGKPRTRSEQWNSEDSKERERAREVRRQGPLRHVACEESEMRVDSWFFLGDRRGGREPSGLGWGGQKGEGREGHSCPRRRKGAEGLEGGGRTPLRQEAMKEGERQRGPQSWWTRVGKAVRALGTGHLGKREGLSGLR